LIGVSNREPTLSRFGILHDVANGRELTLTVEREFGKCASVDGLTALGGEPEESSERGRIRRAVVVGRILLEDLLQAFDGAIRALGRCARRHWNRRARRGCGSDG
jgi:hypothetical protein